MSEAAPPASRRRLAWILVGIAALVAAVRIVTATFDPDLAPEAALEQARLAAEAGRLDEAAAHAREALARRPLDGRPYQQLAAIAAAQGDAEAANALARLAVRHAPREALARAMAAQEAMAASDWAEAVRHYDHLLRVTPALAAQVFPVFVALAQVEEARAPLVARLAAAPAWRGAFLREFARSAPEPRLLFRDALLKDALSPEEAAAYLDRYVAEGRWDDAFVAWAELLPPESLSQLTTPMDGGFELPLVAGPPFSWEIRAPQGVEAGIRPLPGAAGHALRVQFLGRRSAFSHVRQLLRLPAGHFVLRWRQQLDDLQSARGLRWTVTCAGGPKTRIMASGSAAGTSGWQERSAAFAVPADCPAQWLVLELEARIPAETLAAGTAWIDDVRVVPANDG